MGERATVGEVVCIMGVERAEDCSGSGCRWFWMRDAVHEQRKTQDVGEQYELLSDIRAYLANLSQELDACVPLFEAETCFSRKVMDVLNQAVHYVFGTRVRALRIDQLCVICDVLDGEVFEWWQL